VVGVVGEGLAADLAEVAVRKDHVEGLDYVGST
jgi:hypothetical protein